MEKLGSCVPTIDERYNHQAKLQDISDEEFEAIFKPPTFTMRQRLYQVLCFIIFLGPIRLIVCTFMFVICTSLVVFIRVAMRYLGLHPDSGRGFCANLARLGFRVLLLGIGNVWVNVTGYIDDSARFVIANHVSPLDTVVIYMLLNVSCVLKKHSVKSFFVRTFLDVVNPIYVERSGRGRDKEIIDRADDDSAFPVLLFPEVEATRGDVLLEFHQTAFLTPYKVQPMLIRYWMGLVPRGWNSVAWVGQSAASYIWQLVSMPFIVISVDILQTISMEREGKADIETFTRNAQILLANHLKIRAISRSSHDLKSRKYE